MGKGGGHGKEGLEEILIFRTTCFAALGHKKRAGKCMEKLKKKLPQEQVKQLGWLNSLVENMTALVKKSKKLDRSVSTMKCSNPACENVESKVREFRICSRCKQPSYCSRECQKEHWKYHKYDCAK